jgi:hypothetical protein
MEWYPSLSPNQAALGKPEPKTSVELPSAAESALSQKHLCALK